MKNSFALLVGLGLLSLGVPHVSRAQTGPASGPFADVPADHWAYSAVETLRQHGIVIGYPDGTYGGKRAMTRYEFAVGLARALPQITGSDTDTSKLATVADLQALSDDLNAKIAGNTQAIDALKALVNEFKPELEKLGQDVAAIQQRLGLLEQRVAAVEDEQRRFKVAGSLDIIGRGDASTHTSDTGAEQHFLDKNGVQTGKETSKRLFQDADVYHNLDLVLTGRVSDTATANVRASFSNYLSAVRNTAAIGYGTDNTGYTGFDAQPGYLTGGDSTQTFLREAYVDAPLRLGPLRGATVDVGRIPVQFSRYTLKQVDADVYTTLYETDSGNIPVDGGKLAFHVGPVRALAFAGKNDTVPFAQSYVGSQAASIQTLLCGCSLNGIQSRPFGQILQNQASGVAQSAGLRATVGTPQTIAVSGTLEEFGLSAAPLDPDNGVSYNKLIVYGADVNGVLPFGLGRFVKKGGIGISGDITNSVEGGLKTNANYGYRYMQHDENVSLQFGALSVQGGYQYVGPYFSAPGYWGKVGAWTNPTNVQGPVYSAKYALTPRVTLNADYEQYKAAYGDAASPLQAGDHLNRYQVGLGYGLTSADTVDMGYEDVQYDLRNARGGLFQPGKPRETYLTFGLGHSFNSSASFKLLYQIVRYDDKGTGFDAVNGDGDVAVGQFSVKF